MAAPINKQPRANLPGAWHIWRGLFAQATTQGSARQSNTSPHPVAVEVSTGGGVCSASPRNASPVQLTPGRQPNAFEIADLLAEREQRRQHNARIRAEFEQECG